MHITDDSTGKVIHTTLLPAIAADSTLFPLHTAPYFEFVYRLKFQNKTQSSRSMILHTSIHQTESRPRTNTRSEASNIRHRSNTCARRAGTRAYRRKIRTFPVYFLHLVNVYGPELTDSDFHQAKHPNVDTRYHCIDMEKRCEPSGETQNCYKFADYRQIVHRPARRGLAEFAQQSRTTSCRPLLLAGELKQIDCNTTQNYKCYVDER